MGDRIKVNKQLREARSTGKRKFSLRIGYIYFLFLLGMLYIANAQWAENKSRKILKLKDECKELNWLYLTEKSALLHEATYSKLEDQLAGSNVQPSRTAPKLMQK